MKAIEKQIRPFVLQKDNVRYTFNPVKMPDGRYQVTYEYNMVFGSSMSYEYYKKDAGNSLYKKLLENGFKRFRSWDEVSWYATVENNTPYAQEWTTEGIWFVPVNVNLQM